MEEQRDQVVDYMHDPKDPIDQVQESSNEEFEVQGDDELDIDEGNTQDDVVPISEGVNDE